MALPPNLAAVPTVTYEYLFYLQSSERLWPSAQWEARGLLSGFCTPGAVDHQLRPINLDMISALQQQMAEEPSTLYRIGPHHSWLKRRGHQLKKN
jgi:hypothetical protein